MASIRVVAPAEQVQLWARDTEQLVLQEKAFDRASGVWRSADQIRADLVVTMPGLLLGARADAGIGTRVAPSKETLVNVFVPVVTLLEHGNEPGELEGYGPISAEHVRLLLPHARLRRALVDAETGQPVSLDEDVQPASGDIDIARQRLLAMVRPSVVTHRSEPQHDPSASLRRFVDLRDLRCDGIGCSVPARRSHKDHRIPWPEGPTAAWNLDARSGSCHRAKHSGWRVKVEADGSTAWLSPLGRSYLRPPPYSPPLLPPDGARLRPPRKPATEAAPDDAGDGPMTLPASPVDVVRPEPTDDEDDCPF